LKSRAFSVRSRAEEETLNSPAWQAGTQQNTRQEKIITERMDIVFCETLPWNSTGFGARKIPAHRKRALEKTLISAYSPPAPYQILRAEIHHTNCRVMRITALPSG
jgi:hypothetical protein